MRRLTAVFLLLAGLCLGADRRLVSVGTSVTETLTNLGVHPELVAVDNSSREYIPDVAKLPTVGAFRTISAEGIISLKPTTVFLSIDAGPPTAIKQLRDAQVDVVIVPKNYTLDEVKSSVHFIAAKLGLQARGDEIVASIDRDMARVTELQRSLKSKPKVVFCGIGPNAPTGSISGTNTRIDEMIKLSGGINPIQSFEGLRPMTEEGLIAANPDILLITERGFERAGGVEGVRKLPGVALTTAGRAGRVVPVSDIYFQGFGPGIGKAVLELTKRLHPELK